MSELSRITWSKDFFLKWSDYQAVPDPTSRFDAQTRTTISQESRFYLHKTSSKFKFKISNIKLTAVFIPSISWVKETARNAMRQDQLLKHEQGHFDATEDLKRKMENKLIHEIESKTFSSKGETLEECRNYADRETTEIIRKKLLPVIDSLEAFHKKYDKDTDYGRNVRVQEEYDRRFAKLRLR